MHIKDPLLLTEKDYIYIYIFFFFFFFERDVYLIQPTIITTQQLYHLSHLDTAELSPLMDMHGAISTQSTCIFILNSAVHCDRCCRLVPQFLEMKETLI